MQGRWTSIGGVRAGRAEETRPHARAGHPPPPPLAPRSPVKTVLPRAAGTPSVCNARAPTKRGAVPDAAKDRWLAVPGRTGGTAGQGQPPPAAPPRDRAWGWPWGGKGGASAPAVPRAPPAADGNSLGGAPPAEEFIGDTGDGVPSPPSSFSRDCHRRESSPFGSPTGRAGIAPPSVVCFLRWPCA